MILTIMLALCVPLNIFTATHNVKKGRVPLALFNTFIGGFCFALVLVRLGAT